MHRGTVQATATGGGSMVLKENHQLLLEGFTKQKRRVMSKASSLFWLFILGWPKKQF